jgi:DNA-binding NtrC family response regulator
MAKVLILDQAKSIRNILRERLEFEGYATTVAEPSELSERVCARRGYDAIVAGERCGEVAKLGIPYIVITAEGSIDGAVMALKDGAEDYLTTPVDMNRLLYSLRRIMESKEEGTADVVPSVRQRHRSSVELIVGQSPAIEHVRGLIERVAPSNARVFITGENGTGKELVARYLHQQSQRAAAPFVEVNCAAIPSELIESELFGHERGAFTSAIKQRKGKFEQANGGTLFMDEIGDMSLSAQAKVLRALQESKISRVGSDRDVEVDVRIVAATNKDLRREIEAGNFREDLYHRLGVVVLSVPPMSERREDVPLLVEHFLGEMCDEHTRRPKEIDADAIERLTRKEWSGNIREIRNVVERLVVLSDDRITLSDVENYAEGL